MSLRWLARSPAPSRGLPHFFSPRARCPFVFFFFLPPPRLSHSFKISYIREAGALRPKRLELFGSYLLVAGAFFFAAWCTHESSSRTEPGNAQSPASLRAEWRRTKPKAWRGGRTSIDPTPAEDSRPPRTRSSWSLGTVGLELNDLAIQTLATPLPSPSCKTTDL